MAVIAGMTNSFKQQLLEGVHDLSSDTMKIALYTSSADLIPSTTVYSTTNEVTTPVPPSWAGDTAYVVGDLVVNGANRYVCTTSGTSASSPGPSGTGADISDGSVVWDYTLTYVAGGSALTNNGIVMSGSTVYLDFADYSWSHVSFTSRGALIYNSDEGNKSIAVLDFGLDIAVSNATFTVKFPTADSNDAIIRIK